MSEDLSHLGEFGLIERLVERLPQGEGVLVGPGDDAAVLAGTGQRMLAAADLLVEGAHFDLAFSFHADVGYKALAVNVSDIAAMGARPRYALVSLGAPAGSKPKDLESLYDGIAEAAEAFGLSVVGGDTVGAPQLIISVAIVGEPGEAGPVTRAGAFPGDLLCVTGELGAAAAGLALLRAKKDTRARELLTAFPGLADAHRRGRARVREGLAAAAAGAHAMIDVSDGLAQDVTHICEASGVGVRIDGPALPVAPGVAEAEDWQAGKGARSDTSLLAVRGGDDYELALALPPDRLEELRDAITPTPLTVIGEFTDARTVAIEGLAEAEFAALGWDHFAR